MPAMDEKTREALRRRLHESLRDDVELTLYRRPDTGRLVLPTDYGCQTCDVTQEVAQELVDASSGKVKLAIVDVVDSGLDEPVPMLTVGEPGSNARIRFQGLPSGYEFASLLEAVERVSARDAGLTDSTSSRLATLESEVEVMVFVTPTCPYCPGAASMASRLAMASERVRAVVVEANEFPDLSAQFKVQGVPRTVINRSGSFVGALPEEAFVDAVLQLAGSPESA